MLYCKVVSIAPAALIAAPAPVFVTDRVKPASALVKKSGALTLAELLNRPPTQLTTRRCSRSSLPSPHHSPDACC